MKQTVRFPKKYSKHVMPTKSYKLLEHSSATDNGVVVACWSLLIHSRNMAKSAIHKLLTEILHGIEKLIYIRFIDKH